MAEVELRFFLVKTREFVIMDPWFRQLSYNVAVIDTGPAHGVQGAGPEDHIWTICITPQVPDLQAVGMSPTQLTISSMLVCGCPPPCFHSQCADGLHARLLLWLATCSVWHMHMGCVCVQVTDYCALLNMSGIRQHNEQCSFVEQEGTWELQGFVQRRQDFVAITIIRTFPTPQRAELI